MRNCRKQLLCLSPHRGLGLKAGLVVGCALVWLTHAALGDGQRGIAGAATAHDAVRLSDLVAREQADPSLANPRIRPVAQSLAGTAAQSPAYQTLYAETALGTNADATAASPLASPPPVLIPLPSASQVGILDDGKAFSPDTAGAVGPNHLMAATETQIQIRHRTTGATNLLSHNAFWAGVRGTNLPNPACIQPRLQYDPYGQRWIFTANADSATTNAGLLVAVSQTPDPTGAWNRYFVVVNTPGRDVFLDTPTTGFNKDWIVVQANVYRRTNSEFMGTDIYVFNKTNLYAGGVGLRTSFLFDEATYGYSYSQTPAATYDPSANVLYLVQNWIGYTTNEFGYLRLYRIEGPVGAEVFKARYGEATNDVYAWSEYTWQGRPPPGLENFAPQLGSSRKLYTYDDRIQNVVYRQGTLWATHSIYLPEVGTPTRCAVQWWMLTPGGQVLEQGRVDNTNNTQFFAYPSIAVNQNLDLLLGYSRFSASQYPSANYAFSAGQDPAGSHRGDVVYKAGEHSFDVTNRLGYNLWGQSSVATVDPLNDVDMWTLQQYASAPVNNDDRWGTWWARVSPPVDLAISQTDLPDPVSVGASLTYTLTVTNLGQAASGVKVTDTLPKNATFVSATTAGGYCTYSNGVVTCDLDTMAQGEQRTVSIVVAPTAAGQITNTAVVLALGPDYSALNNTSRVTTVVQNIAALALMATASPDPVTVSNNLTYTLIVTNLGPATGTGIILTNILPANVNYVSSSTTQGTITRSGSTVACSLGSLAKNASARVTIVAAPRTPGLYTNAATVTASTIDSAPADNAVTLVTRANARPTISTITNQTIVEDGSTAPLAFVIGDFETPPDSLVLTAVSTNQTLVPNVNIVLSGSGSNRTVIVVPAPNRSGATAITLTVTDSDGVSAARTFVVTVTAVNDPPTITPLADQVIAEDTSTGPLAFQIGDVETAVSSLTLSVVSSNTVLIPTASVVLGGSGSNRTVTVTPARNRSGTSLITVRVSDGATTVSETFLVTVNSVNDPPTISNISDRSVNEDSGPVSASFTIGDVETAAANLVLSFSSTNLVLLPEANLSVSGTGTNRTLTMRPATNGFGTTLVTVTVTDTEGGTASDSFLLTVRPVNDPPTLDAVSNWTVSEDPGPQVILLTGITSGAANELQTLSITATSSNTALIPNPIISYLSPESTAILTLQPAANVSGATTITVRINDGGISNNLVTRTFTVTVYSVNDPPSINPPGNLSFHEDAPQQTVNLSGITSGAPNETQTLTVTATSSDPSVIPHPAVSYTSPNSTGTLRFTPVPNAHGEVNITVAVRDSGTSNNVTTSVFSVIVNPVNDVPTLNALTNVVIQEDSPPMLIALSGIASGVTNENQILVVTAASSNPTVVPDPTVLYSSPEGTGSLVIVPATNAFGSATIAVTVNDGGASNNLVTRAFTVTVDPVNDAPTLAPVPDLTIDEDAGAQVLLLSGITAGALNENQTVTLTVSNSNPALLTNLALSYASPAATGSLRFETATNASGIALITLRLGDGGTSNNFSQQTFQVVVDSVNDLPLISSIPDQTITEDAVLAPIAFTVSDVETRSTDLEIQVFSLNPELVDSGDLVLSGNGTNRLLTPRLLPDQHGLATIALVVTDGDQGSSITWFELNVNPANDPPSITSIPDQSLNEDALLGPLSFTVDDAETPPGQLIVTAHSSNHDLLPGEQITLGGGGAIRTLSLVPATNRFGAATITLGVSDGTTNRTTSFQLRVNPVNDAPTLDQLADRTVTQNAGEQVVLLSGISAGASNELQTVLISAASSNPSIIPAPAVTYTNPASSGTLRFTPVANATGTVVITITVRDDGGTSLGGQDTLVRRFSVEVRPPFFQPRLHISLEGTNVVVAWPDPSTGFVLERTSGVGVGAVWSAVDLVPAVTNGMKKVAFPAVGPMQFFRLAYRPQPEDKPTLAIAVTGTQVILTWPSVYVGYGLERTSDLAQVPVNWQAVGSAPVESEGRMVVTLPRTARVDYYRLRK